MRKFSSLASRVAPEIPNPAEKINYTYKPKVSGPSKASRRKKLGQNPKCSSAGEHEFKDFSPLSIPKPYISGSAKLLKSKPIDHRYLAEILSRKDWYLLLNHEFKAQKFGLDAQIVVSILQNQENPLCSLKFYIWVSNISSSFTKNQSICSALSNALYRQGPVLLSAELVQDIRNSGCRVNEDLLCLLIGSWGRLGLAKYCTEIFNQISYLGISPSTRLYNAVIDGLVKSNSLDLAYLMFQQMEVDNCAPDRFTYNIIIHGVCKAGVVDEALRLVKQMEGLGYSPNVFTYTMLIDGFCNTKRVDEAFRVLDKMKEKNVMPNDVTYRSLVNGVFRSLSSEEAFVSLSRWINTKPNLPNVVYDTVLYCLCNSSLPKHAADFFKATSEKGYVPVSSVTNIIMTCLIKGLDLEETCPIFDTLIKRKVKIDLKVCLSLLEALYKRGRDTKGNWYFSWILQEGLVTNVYAYNMLIDCFCKVQKMDRAFATLGEMHKRSVPPNLVTFNTLIAGYCKVRDVVNTQNLLAMLLDRGFKPDVFTFSSIIDVLCQVNQMDDAFGCFSEMIEWGITPTAIMYNSLIRSLCLCGDVTKAMKLLRNMKSDGMQPDVCSFNSLMKKYCKINKLDKAQRLLTSMLVLDLCPDNVTYNAFINALCESGRSEEAKVLFYLMEANGCALDTDTCNAFIDALVKSGEFGEAEAVWLKYKSKGMALRTLPIVSRALVGRMSDQRDSPNLVVEQLV